MERATTALARVGPALNAESARMCVMSMVGQLLHSLRAHHLLADLGRTGCCCREPVRPDYVAHFVRFSVGGILACAADPSPTTRLSEVAQ